MMGMTIKVHKLSKKYGDTKFIFFIVFLLISSFIFQQAFTAYISTSNIDNVTLVTLFLIILQLLTSIITVHLLIGNRILYLRRHPVKNTNKLNNSEFKNINNIVNFIGQKRNMSSSFSIFDSSSSKSITKYSSDTYINMDSNYSKKDQMMKGKILSNSNYRSFSNTLQSFNSSVNDFNYNEPFNNTYNMSYKNTYNNNIVDENLIKNNYYNNSNSNNNNYNNNSDNNKNNFNSYYYYDKLNIKINKN